MNKTKQNKKALTTIIFNFSPLNSPSTQSLGRRPECQRARVYLSTFLTMLQQIIFMRAIKTNLWRTIILLFASLAPFSHGRAFALYYRRSCSSCILAFLSLYHRLPLFFHAKDELKSETFLNLVFFLPLPLLWLLAWIILHNDFCSLSCAREYF